MKVYKDLHYATLMCGGMVRTGYYIQMLNIYF